ncbi:hypothetical protein [Staphylococcus americanisciuri]|uniref:Uncharacterized protein n=1 Tax=Staphylococcus americanisciuri TaxID=2973940 RepID=A0ABT2F435_9STAP|nr:hypothetical protein [Staphylococcus americanisciuri]MCS4487206.1 hypothetical protein [Staphylococcus americanisciuri]
MSKDYKRRIADLCAERVKLDSENSRLLKTVAKLSDERDRFKRERDELIDDIACVREQRKYYADENIKLVKMTALVMDERDELKRKLDEVVELFVSHINYKSSVAHSPKYIDMRHKLNKILESEKENGYERTN